MTPTRRHFIARVGRTGGFTIIEVMVVTLLVTAMTAGIYLIFSTGQATWFTTDVTIQIQDNLRQALQRISMELRQSRADQKYVFDGTGVNGTDILRFSIPIMCEADDSFIDGDGNVPHWGGPLTWGCDSLSCMDEDGDCTTIEYKFIEYLVDSDQRLRREVLDEDLVIQHSDVFAEHVSDFQVTVNGNIISLSATVEEETVTNRAMTGQASVDVYLRN